MDSWPIQILVQVILILVNAFFAASEIAIISLNKIKLKKEAEQGSKSAKKLLKLAEMPDKFLSTIQVGITLAGFLGSAFAADNFADRLVDFIYYENNFTGIPYAVLDTLCVILITIILSYFTLVFGELVPKRIAMKKPDGVAKITCNVVYYISKIMSPIIWFLAASCNVVLRCFGIKAKDEEENVTEEEIQLLVDTAEENGTIEDVEHTWISNVFTFNDKQVTKVMTPALDVCYITEDMTYSEIEAYIKKYRHTRIPYCKTGLNDIIGILNIKDFFIKDFDNIEQILRKPYYVSEFTLADDLFKSLQVNRNNLAIVVDEYGNTIGIVTTEDLLEEIVGDLYDEDEEKIKANIIEIEPNKYEVDGNIQIEEFEKFFNIKVDDDSFDTLSGLIFSNLDYVPNHDDAIEITLYGLHLKVLEIRKRRIAKVLVERLIENNEQEHE